MKRSSSEAKPSAKLVGAMSSSIADRTDAAVKLVSEFIIEDKVERSVTHVDLDIPSYMYMYTPQFLQYNVGRN